MDDLETINTNKQTNTNLHEGPRLLAELVVVFELDSDGLVAVQAR